MPVPSEQQLRLQQNADERRERSFVIIGLRELPDGTESEKRQEDLNAALDIVRYLGGEDYISQSDVKRTRNGQCLIVTLETVASRNRILRRSHFLHRNPQTCYIRLAPAYTSREIFYRFGRMTL